MKRVQIHQTIYLQTITVLLIQAFEITIPVHLQMPTQIKAKQVVVQYFYQAVVTVAATIFK